MSEQEHETEEHDHPCALDIDGSPVWVHKCETEEGADMVHVTVQVSTGVCDHGAEHFEEVHWYGAPDATRRLAAALLNASDECA